MSDLIYFDNNATTAVAPEVLEAMLPYLGAQYANPSSMYSFAAFSQDALILAHEQVAALLGAKPGETMMTSCGTEGDSTAIYAALEAQPDKRRFITTRVEHPAVLAVGQHLEKRGYDVVYVDVDARGRLDLDQLKDSLTGGTALVSVMFANNETGNIHPIAEIGALGRERGVPCPTDAVQAVGKVPRTREERPVVALALSGHKLHAPKGVGCLYIRVGAPYRPFLRGGHQEYGRRAGTQAVPNIVALGKACELARQHLEEENTRVRALRDDLQSRLLAAIPDALVNGDQDRRLPNTLNISFKYVEGEAILLMLDQYNICASSGSACTSGSLEPSHVLRAMGLPFSFAHGSLRLSLSRYTSQADVEAVVERLPPIIARLRELSPYKDLPDNADPGSCESCGACAV
jgi:cysteine desulfurase